MYPTSQNRLWLCHRSSYTNQGMFPAPLSRSAPGSHMARVQRSTNWIMSGLGYSAQISAVRLTEGQMERDRTSLVSLCTVPSINCRCESNQRCVSRTAHHIAFDRRTVADIERNLAKWDKRNGISRCLHAKKGKEKIAAWRLGLENILGVFNVRSVA